MCDEKVNKEKIKDMIIDGLITNGGHHKQWFLEKILEEFGYDLKETKEKLEIEEGYTWESGIPP